MQLQEMSFAIYLHPPATEIRWNNLKTKKNAFQDCDGALPDMPPLQTYRFRVSNVKATQRTVKVRHSSSHSWRI